MNDDGKRDELDDDPPVPPTPVQVARRALILAAVCLRANLDYAPDDTTEIVRDNILDWADMLGLPAHYEPADAAILNAHIGTIPKSQRAPATWLAEGLGVLAWALGRADWPSHQENVLPTALYEAVGLLDDEAAAELLRRPHLRPTVQLRAAREWMYDLHVRLVQHRRHNPAHRFREWVAGHLRDLGVPVDDVLAGDDLLIAGQPLAECDRDDKAVTDVETLTFHRHRAAMWLADCRDGYHGTSPDT